MASPQRTWPRLRRHPMFLVALPMIAVLVAVAVAPGVFTGADPASCLLERSRSGPGNGALFGYTVQGCDLYARLVYGTRASLLVGVSATALVVLVGGVVGVLAGYAGGWMDAVLSRVTDVAFGIPVLLGALVVLVAFPSPPSASPWQTTAKVVVAMALLGWTTVSRIARARVVELREADYVRAAAVMGSGHVRILLRHLVPGVLPPVLAWASVAVGMFIAVEATLSFIGIGLQPPVISWGLEISEAQAYVRQSPHMILFPSAVLSFTVLAFVLLGDAVRDALNPRSGDRTS